MMPTKYNSLIHVNLPLLEGGRDSDHHSYLSQKHSSQLDAYLSNHIESVGNASLETVAMFYVQEESPIPAANSSVACSGELCIEKHGGEI